MAAFATLMAFPVFDAADEPRNFLCIEIQAGGSQGFDCGPLYLNSPEYWQNEETEGWAGAVQAAAVFGIFAAAMGFVSFALLMTATCFSLAPRRLLSILIMQVICAVFTILTFVAGAADACKKAGLDDTPCETEKIRIEEGAGFMLFAFFLYIAAGVMTFFFFREARRGAKESHSITETEKLKTSAVPPTIDEIEEAGKSEP
jgi:hypothetical protein